VEAFGIVNILQKGVTILNGSYAASLMGCEEEAAVYATGAAAAEIYRLISTSRTHASKMALRKEKITASKRSFPFL
jgi:hypothetical protein